jgi:Fe-S oxidoreductase
MSTQPRQGFDYADYFAQISVLGDLLRDRPERVWLTTMPADPEPKQFVVWLGCNVLRTVHIVETLDDILRHIGVEYVMLGGPANCCGVQHARRDDAETGRKLAWRTFEKFDAFQPERLLFWCPSCDQRVEGMGSDVSALVGRRQHVTEFFVEHLDLFDFKPLDRPLRVALHAHTGSPQQDLDARATRRLLEAIPGVEVVDLPAMADLGRHCASPEVTRLPAAQFRARLDASVAEATRRGVESLVTIYHACHRELVPSEIAADAEEVFGPLRVENYLTLVARSLGLPEHVDRFKRYAQLGDPKRILAELGPRIAELGLAPERAERVIAAQFGGPGRTPERASLS